MTAGVQGSRWARTAALVAGASIFLILPSSAGAATVIVGRQNLELTPTTKNLAANCYEQCVTTFVQRTAESGSLTTVPANGQITDWAFRGDAGGLKPKSWTLRVLRPVGGSMQAVGSSPPVILKNRVLEASLLAGSPIHLASPIPVQAGDRIGVTVTSEAQNVDFATVDTDGSSTYDVFGPVPEGSTQKPLGSGTGELFLNATVQAPDAPAPLPADTVAPTLSSFAISPTKFVAANTGPALISARVGADVFYRLSEAATTSFTVERGSPGSKHGKKCGKARPKGGAKPCTRYSVIKPSLSDPGDAGLNSVRFMGRLGKKALKPGKYRLSAIAIDAAGNRSKPRTVAFRVVG